MKRLRLLLQLAVVVAAATAGVRFALGRSFTTVETWCPFGGLETAYSFVTHRRFSCAAGETNLAIFLALLVLTVLARKAFCGWVCPVGTLFEWEARLARRLFKRRDFGGPWRLPRRVDRGLKIGLRLLVLAVILAATWKTGELVFRGYDPYYIAFSAHGHDVQSWSYAVLGGLLLLGLALPLAWCKYLCPLGVVLWPVSLAGRLRLERRHASCTGCGACDRACPQDLAVSTVPHVGSGECTLCLECTAACPAPGALELAWSGVGSPARGWIVPLLVVACATGGVAASRLLVAPSLTEVFAVPAAGAPTRTSVFVVEGVKCVDTAARATGQLRGVAGIYGVEAYAPRARLHVTFDPARTDPAALREAFESAVHDTATGEYLFNLFRVVEIDGQKIASESE